MTDTTTTPTPEQIAAARVIVAEADAAAARAAAETRAAALAPIKALVENTAFDTVLTGVLDLRAAADVTSDIFAHLHAAAVGLNGLKSVAG